MSGSNTHYLTIKLFGRKPNIHAIGARIYLTTESGTQMREVRIENNYVSQNPVESHFGLGANPKILKLEVVWPDGTKQIIPSAAGNRLMVIHQPE